MLKDLERGHRTPNFYPNTQAIETRLDPMKALMMCMVQLFMLDVKYVQNFKGKNWEGNASIEVKLLMFQLVFYF